MALLIGAEFADREDACRAQSAVAGLGIELARNLLVEPTSPSRPMATSPQDGPLVRRARLFDQRIARGATGGAIVVGTGLAFILAPAGLMFFGAAAGAVVGAVVGSLMAATSDSTGDEDAMKLLIDVSSRHTWVLIIEVQAASEAHTVREVLNAWGGEDLDPWRSESKADGPNSGPEQQNPAPERKQG